MCGFLPPCIKVSEKQSALNKHTTEFFAQSNTQIQSELPLAKCCPNHLPWLRQRLELLDFFHSLTDYLFNFVLDVYVHACSSQANLQFII